MKNIIISTILVFLFAACTSNSKKADSKLYKKGATQIATIYPNVQSIYELNYNNHNQITKITDTDVNIDLKYNYNKKGLIDKTTYYDNGVLFKYKTYKWFTDSLLISGFEITENATIENQREICFYNKSNEMIGVEQYEKDSVGEWHKIGSRYEFIWENGNMINIKCFIPSESIIQDSLIVDFETDKKGFGELDDLSNKINNIRYDLFYESTYTYDDKNNPYNDISISRIIFPNQHNISTNNPISIEKKYTGGDVINFTLEYEFNENNYPIMTNILVKSNMEGLEKVSFTREFKY